MDEDKSDVTLQGPRISRYQQRIIFGELADKTVALSSTQQLKTFGVQAAISFEAPPATPQRVPIPSQLFVGLEDNQTTIPPDTNGAVGPTHVVTMLNDRVRIHNKSTGATLSTVSLDTFMGASQCFDPRIRYDTGSSRWIAACCARSPSRALLRCSFSSDPTAGFGIVYSTAAAAGEFFDFTQLGFNASAIVITFNMFNFPALNSFLGCRLLVYDKAAVLVNSSFSATNIGLTNPNTDWFTFMPAVTYNNSDPTTLYLVQDWPTGTQLRISTLTGLPATPVLNSNPPVFTPPQSSWAQFPPTDEFAPQYGTSTKISVGDSRMQHVVHTGGGAGTLYCAHTIFLPANQPSLSAVQWWQLSLGGAILQRGWLDDSANGLRFYAFPSIAVNSLGDVVVGCSAFSPFFYASGVYAFHAAGDAAGTMRDVVTYASGLATYVKRFSGNENRWGDYSTCQVDPSDDSFWCLQEQASTSNSWLTVWCHIPNAIPAALPYRAPCDINGDGKSDIIVWRPSSGYWFAKLSPSYTTGQAIQWGAQGDVTLPGRYQGLSTCDVAVWRPSATTHFLLKSPMFSSSESVLLGEANDVQRVADLDGDGKADRITCNNSTYLWTIKRSSILGSLYQQWGAPGDVLVPADYSGTGKSEMAVWRPSSGTWFILHSNGRLDVQQWGAPGDIPVPGDYDGDGKADFAVWRPSNGTWYIIKSSGGLIAKQWGLQGDVPTVLDTDGDGKMDFVVYRPSNTMWYITRSSDNVVVSTQWGTSTDIVPAPTSA